MFDYANNLFDVVSETASDGTTTRILKATPNSALDNLVCDGLVVGFETLFPFVGADGKYLIYPAADDGFIEITAHGNNNPLDTNPDFVFFKKRFDFSAVGGFNQSVISLENSQTFKIDTFEYEVETPVINGVLTEGLGVVPLIIRQIYGASYYSTDDLYYNQYPSLPFSSIVIGSSNLIPQTRLITCRAGLYPCSVIRKNFSISFSFPTRWATNTFPGTQLHFLPLVYLNGREKLKIVGEGENEQRLTGVVTDRDATFNGVKVFDFPIDQVQAIAKKDGAWQIFYKDFADGKFKAIESFSTNPKSLDSYGEPMTIFTDSEFRFFSVVRLRSNLLAAAAVRFRPFTNGVELLFKRQNADGSWPSDDDAVFIINQTSDTSFTKSSIVLSESPDATLTIYSISKAYVSTDGGRNWNVAT